MPPIIVTATVFFVAIIHVAIAIVEIFFWQQPFVYERLGFTHKIAQIVAPIVANAGLYNSFIAAGLVWGAFAKNNAISIRVFFLVCVIVAGIFGAFTLKPTTLALQTIPAFLALVLVWFAVSKKVPELKN
ncbi:MAG: DUF1304 domain-containing protein [Oscillatoria sp. PMC 1068.18]|nr:DUF1304 domain-containing protein [Oscillatoria sp. PMC 1076.18]MEC4990497.1 DUF1304 domain-containing protein [Oscillatoria sp. PMC 1068.18]